MIHVAVVAHHSRQHEAEHLAFMQGAELFLDHLTLGATWNHLRALNWGATKTGHLIVLEDDAQPVNGFLTLAQEWVNHHPNDLTSFYLGTGKPPQYQADIRAKLEHAEAYGLTHIELPQLIHAVAYVIPCERIPQLNLNTRAVADYGVGKAWTQTTRKPILYTVPSYVDHADTPSVEQRGRRMEPRKAWRLHEGL